MMLVKKHTHTHKATNLFGFSNMGQAIKKCPHVEFRAFKKKIKTLNEFS